MILIYNKDLKIEKMEIKPYYEQNPIKLKSDLLLNNFNDKSTFTNNYNITGITLPKFSHTTKHKNLVRSNSLTIPENNCRKTDINFYSTLKKEEKIKYINDLITNAFKTDSFDGMALKRKKISIGELINQFDITNNNKPKKFEENKICKIPYPLINYLTNRKLENNSSNLLTKILTKENKILTKKQELIIKYSQYSKIFTTDISKLINNEIIKKEKIIKKPKIGQEKFPILNKYLKKKFCNLYFKDFNSIKYSNLMPNTPMWTKLNIKKNIKRWNSSNYKRINNKKAKDKNIEFNNVVETFKNKSVNLLNHNSNMKNIKLMQERIYNMLEDKILGNNKNKFDPTINKIIKDVSHLKFNNQIMAFSENVNKI
jgi:hypothetical protein